MKLFRSNHATESSSWKGIDDETESQAMTVHWSKESPKTRRLLGISNRTSDHNARMPAKHSCAQCTRLVFYVAQPLHDTHMSPPFPPPHRRPVDSVETVLWNCSDALMLKPAHSLRSRMTDYSVERGKDVCLIDADENIVHFNWNQRSLVKSHIIIAWQLWWFLRNSFNIETHFSDQNTFRDFREEKRKNNSQTQIQQLSMRHTTTMEL